MTNFNSYTVNAELAHRHSQIRSDYSPRRGSKRHIARPKLPALPRLPKVRFTRPAATA